MHGAIPSDHRAGRSEYSASNERGAYLAGKLVTLGAAWKLLRVDGTLSVRGRAIHESQQPGSTDVGQ